MEGRGVAGHSGLTASSSHLGSIAHTAESEPEGTQGSHGPIASFYTRGNRPRELWEFS